MIAQVVDGGVAGNFLGALAVLIAALSLLRAERRCREAANEQ